MRRVALSAHPLARAWWCSHLATGAPMTEPVLHQTFSTTLYGSGNNVAIVVPDEVVDGFARGKRVPVVVHVDDGFSYRSSITSMGGRYLISFSAAVRAATGKAAGDRVTVRLDVDD